MDRVPGWRTDYVSAVRSTGGTYALLDYCDNFLVPTNLPWPPPELAQKLFQSQKLDHFPEDAHPHLVARLGHYCDLQSIHSEDALTWNVFGNASHKPMAARSRFSTSLLARLGEFEQGDSAHIWLWRRLPHPETLGSNGPELDFGVHVGRTLILGESKWHGTVSQGQGLGKDQNQIQIRLGFLRRSGRLLFPDVRRFIFLGLSIKGTLLEEETFHEDGIAFRQANLCWQDMLDIVPEEDLEAYARYLAWKVQHGRIHLSDESLLSKLELKVPSRVRLVDPPEAFFEAIGDVPQGLNFDHGDGGLSDTGMAFPVSMASLDASIARALEGLRPGGKVWVCWPMRTSDLRSDIGKDAVIAAGDRFGLVRVKAARIDRTWTAFKFFRRKEG